MQTPKFEPGNICVIKYPRSHPFNGALVVLTTRSYNHFTDMFTYQYQYQDEPDSKIYQCLDEVYLELKAPNA